jgi:hypothetical protein
MEKSPIPLKKLSLLLRCYADMRRGVGTAYALPVLRYGGKRWSAGKVSLALGPEGITLGNRRVSRDTLEALGVGPLGRFIDGAPIVPVKLKPWELLCRGGEGIGAFCSGFEFDRDLWIRSAEPEIIFAAHLDFLRAYGICGGILAEDERESAAFLAAYLRALSEKEETGNILILMRENRRPAYTERNLPWPEGVRLDFYERITGEPKAENSKWDMLILIEPEEITGESIQTALYKKIEGIETRLRLGICFDPPSVLSGPHAKGIKAFFGIRGKMRTLAKYVFRDPREALSLPRRYPWNPRIYRGPPDPFGGEAGECRGARFIIRHRFRSLPSSKFKEEQQWFPRDGPASPPKDYPIRHDYELSFDRLDQKQRSFFLYWRGEFRRGNPLETYPAYILLYARELILSMGTNPPMENFRELLRLWRSYREAEPRLDETFPQWLIDFAVLYEITGEALPLLLPFAGESRLPLLRDLYIHQYYIEAGNPPVFADLTRLLDGAETAGPSALAARNPQEEERLQRVFEALDRYLRETYGKGLLVFFYPAISAARLFYGFAAFHDTGDSAYTAEWIGFCDHKPLRDFMQRIAAYLAYRFRRESAASRKPGEPPLEPVWKEIIHRELGLAPPEQEGRPIILEADTVARLRDESDEVRDLLRLDEEYDAPEEYGDRTEAAGVFKAAPDSLGDFLRGLGEVETETLRLVAGQEPGEALRKLALENMTMPELLFDTINEAFWETFGDLLIDTLDGVPALHAEYKESIQTYFGTGA